MLGTDFTEDASSEDASILRLRIPPNPRFGKVVRDAVIAHAERFGVVPGSLADFLFAIGEGLANAVEHSSTSDAIDVRCRVDHEKIVVTIVDSGCGFSATPGDDILPAGLVERGRGLPIMRRCSDIFAVHSVPGRGTAIVIGRYIRPRPEETSVAS
ncbi:MAG: ATP-binding protein [Candidatus Eremiobacteraeota bacterium]|nr:ATP-binding protein [Candidatus Eremiobacteraeota bacterium]